jgi:hypothetical protein
MRGIALVIVMFGLGASGCSGAARPQQELPSSGAKAPGEPPKAAWRWASYSPPGAVTFVESGADGTQRVLVGGFRAEQRGTQVELSREAASAELVRSCRTDGGFIHYSLAGELFWSETFLGPLIPSGTSPVDFRNQLAECGPVVVSAREDRGFAVVSRQGSRPLAAGDARLVAVQFSTPTLGRAIAEPDRLLETRNGGQTFTEPAARPPAELDRPAAWLGAEPSRPERRELHGEAAAPVLRAWLERALDSEVGRLVEGLRLSDGTWVRTLQDDREFYVAFRSPDGKLSSHAVRGACHAQPWGSHLLLDCAQSAGNLRLFGPGGEQPISQPPQQLMRVFADAEGSCLFGLGVGERQGKRATSSGPLVFEGGRWREFAEPDVVPIALRNCQVLLKRRAGTLAVVSLARAGELRGLEGASITAGQAELLTDQLVYLRRAAGPETLADLVWLGLGGPAASREFPLAVRVRRLGFADALHGAVIDEKLAISVTNDGGSRFIQVPYLGTKLTQLASVRCWSRGCAIGGRFAFTSEPFRDEILASAGARVAEGPPGDGLRTATDLARADNFRPGQASPKYRCTAKPALLSAGQFNQDLFKREPPDAGEMAGHRSTALSGLLERRAGGLFWQALDRAGKLEVATPPLLGAGASLADASVPLVPLELHPLAPVVTPLLLARRFALLLSRNNAESSLFVVRADGQTELLLTTPGRPSELELLSTASGGAALLLSQPTHHELLELGSSGNVLHRRWLALPAGHLALSASGPWFVLPQTEERALLYSSAPGSAPLDLRLAAPSVLGACTGAAAPGTWLMLSRRPRGPELSLPGFQPLGLGQVSRLPSSLLATALVEVGAESSCLRRVRIDFPVPGELVFAKGATLEGAVLGPDGQHELSCVLQDGAKQ